MKKILIGFLLFWGITAQAQFSKASLQASGLTCSMCSKAVKIALENVPFVDGVQVDIKNQQYNLTFKQHETINLDALSKAVEDAGFSVASLQVTASVNPIQLKKDEHVQIGGQTFHFLNAKNQLLNGSVVFSVVDKSFVSAKDFKKFAAMTKMACVQSGRMETCCSKSENNADGRVFHVII